ncbi:hypothetical protein WLQ65_23140 [Pseudoalteromonas piscicida]|uniref:hypothetical protein n=1 Tax=Pseudoalteromonas piscicida TaxID=43662 RepID=UPI000B4FEAEA|nr:hypothetical protein [Pseudoalteromonas piscicida]ASD68814.1 hypothetical protein B1L02_18460 [Pseudoalteromonas piscicida]
MKELKINDIKNVDGGFLWSLPRIAVSGVAMYRTIDQWNSNSGFRSPMSYPGTYRGSDLHYYSDPLL